MPIALLLSLVMGSAASHWVWVWCEGMQEARLHCCCPPERADAETPDRITRACCEGRTASALPTSTSAETAAAITVPPGAIIGVLPLEIAFGAVSLDPGSAHDRPEARAGPHERVHERASVYLI